ncbi:MAG TPA: RluA family pseudouridine synthase [Candidatus Latescibacteria bacterium]|nr:RluA family pseudouridine synthase [Candidatus Latescibacterota bacterium]HJP29848.1 RluA family pseudouridine synthase [Candidatus Latescibacterota bacterium]
MSDLRSFVVDEEAEHSRLDVFLQGVCDDLSRSRIQGLIGTAAVRVGGASRKVSYRVRLGDCVEVDVPEAVPLQAVAQDLPLTILHEDADLLVIDKAAGMTVHPAPGSPDGTLVNALLHHCSDLSGVNGVLRPGIVHRLDRDTTGLLMVAKNDHAHRHLAAQLEARTVERRYMALVWGTVREAGVIDAALNRNPKDRLKMAVVRRGGRRAVTHYEPQEELAGFLTRIALRLETGRTHQIRVHALHMGHPVFGDPVYGGRSQVNGIEPKLRPAAQGLLDDLQRQALHAATLGFVHPSTGEQMRFSSDLPADMEQTLSAARELGSG